MFGLRSTATPLSLTKPSPSRCLSISSRSVDTTPWPIRGSRSCPSTPISRRVRFRVGWNGSIGCGLPLPARRSGGGRPVLCRELVISTLAFPHFGRVGEGLVKLKSLHRTPFSLGISYQESSRLPNQSKYLMRHQGQRCPEPHPERRRMRPQHLSHRSYPSLKVTRTLPSSCRQGWFPSIFQSGLPHRGD